MSIIKHKYVNNITKVKKKRTNNIKKKVINKKVHENNKSIIKVIENRYIFITVIIILSFLLIFIKLFYLQIIKNDNYETLLVAATEKKIKGPSAPRGRIYDRKHRLLVDNKAVKTIYYKKNIDITQKEEIELAYKVSEILDIDYSKMTLNILKDFWYINNREKANEKITTDEWNEYKNRKLNDNDIKRLIYERITDGELKEYDERDKESAYIYYLMNKGYSYAEKIIKNKNVTEKEYATISENIELLNGFNTKMDWERIYPYGSVFKTILGSVSSDTQGIPKELADVYLKKGYSLDDRVGISYLEYQYEDYLKGTKAIYKVNNNNEYVLVSPGQRGNDIVLTIDIELQKYLEEVLANEVTKASKEQNSKYYNHSFAVISDPKSGEILAMAGKQLVKNSKGKKVIQDYTPGIVTLPVTPGSIVKGASILVGYKYGAIKIGSYLVDECIKIKNTPKKCSWRTMGKINDLYALRYSSNVYQYKIAISVGKGKYSYNQPLSLDPKAFSKYRSMYESFGLGVKTGIDLPVESLGYKGSSTLPGHLLDYSIGQYDTYTPIQLSQYINTLANGGTRYKPYLVKEIYSPSVDKTSKFGELIYSKEKESLGTVDVDKKYIDRVRLGFHQVITNGIGYGYMGKYTNSAGKTGTSQSFIDTNNDGLIDTETITTSFIGYAPANNPKMSIVVVSPNIGLPNKNNHSLVTKRISAKMVNKYFELY